MAILFSFVSGKHVLSDSIFSMTVVKIVESGKNHGLSCQEGTEYGKSFAELQVKRQGVDVRQPEDLTWPEQSMFKHCIMSD